MLRNLRKKPDIGFYFFLKIHFFAKIFRHGLLPNTRARIAVQGGLADGALAHHQPASAAG
jgi:hypothetical protein